MRPLLVFVFLKCIIVTSKYNYYIIYIYIYPVKYDKKQKIKKACKP